MNLKKPSVKKIVSIIVAGVLVVCIGLLVRHQFFFFVSGTSPKSGSTVSSTTSVAVISFNKTLDEKQNIYENIEIYPKERFFKDIRVSGKQIIISFASLDIEKEYSITIKNVRSSDGKTIDAVDFTLKTKYVPFSQLSKDQKEESLANIDQGNFDDPILSHIPHETNFYVIDPVFGNTDEGQLALSVRITIKTSSADTKSSIEQHKKDARNYLKEKGIDVNNYVINYEVAGFSDVGSAN